MTLYIQTVWSKKSTKPQHGRAGSTTNAFSEYEPKLAADADLPISNTSAFRLWA